MAINNQMAVKPSSWRALRFYSFYRILLAATFVAIAQVKQSSSFFGAENPELFTIASFAFLIIALLSFIVSIQANHFAIQIQFQVLADILLITLLMHASGGISSGLGMLIAVSTTAASILISTPAALGYSVLASVIIFAEESYSSINGLHGKNSYSQVGILAVTFLGTGLIALYLSRRIQDTERRAEQSIKGLANMEKLNEEIIQYMSTGVVVIDGFQNIRLINRSAWAHLGMPESTHKKRLDQIATPLARQLNLWRRKNHYRSKPFRNTATGPSLLPHFSAIGDTKENAIIFLDDTSMLTQQAQNLKLASLGRLTASIAHEIRNPLGALSHAAQLIKESEETTPDNLALIEIVNNNALRVNEIIENIMQLSTRKEAQGKDINLSRYLESFEKNYLMGKSDKFDSNVELKFHFHSKDILVYFDPTQLEQILNNLFDNGIRYSQMNTGNATLTVMVGIEPNDRTPFIDIIDKGEGIPPDLASKIFEPFFTTSRSGTGLGLYLSRELCEANRARLDYIPLTQGGSCFRISFASSKSPLH